MNTYLLELKRTSYVTVYVEAADKTEAEAKAWAEIENLPESDDATWELSAIEQQFARGTA